MKLKDYVEAMQMFDIDSDDMTACTTTDNFADVNVAVTHHHRLDVE